jgi:hypothetical protein
MSITSPVPDADGIAHTALGQTCFACGQELRDPALHWMGATGDLYWHGDCFHGWIVPMMRDLHELRKPDYYARRLAW